MEVGNASLTVASSQHTLPSPDLTPPPILAVIYKQWMLLLQDLPLGRDFLFAIRTLTPYLHSVKKFSHFLQFIQLLYTANGLPR